MSRPGSACCSQQPQMSFPQSSARGCRPNCTACIMPQRQCALKCPVGIYVERVKSMKPATEFVPSCAKFEGLSSYRELFYPKCGERTKSYKPSASIDPSCAKFDGLTTYREFYYPKCGVKGESFKPAAVADPSCAKMEGISTYRKDFIGTCTERVQSMKPSLVFDPSCAKMDGITTYRINYIPYCPRETSRQESYKKMADVEFSCAPFEGLSTYRKDFWCKPIVKIASMKPTVRGAFSDSPFADRTTYRNDFHPFHFTRNCNPCMPSDPCDTPMFCAGGGGGENHGQSGQMGQGDTSCYPCSAPKLECTQPCAPTLDQGETELGA